MKIVLTKNNSKEVSRKINIYLNVKNILTSMKRLLIGRTMCINIYVRYNLYYLVK
jgi:hypothetical protein